MPFGKVNGITRGMSVLDGVVIIKGEGQFWGEFGASHCNQREFVASLCRRACSDRAVVWDGEWDRLKHSCTGWGYTCVKGKGWILGLFATIEPVVSMT